MKSLISTEADRFAESLKSFTAKLPPGLLIPGEEKEPLFGDYQNEPVKVAVGYWLRWRQEMQARNLAKVFGFCGSPSERALLSGLLCVAANWVDGIEYQYPDRSVISDGDTSSNFLTIAPQKKIGNHKVDFELVWKQILLQTSSRIISGKLEQIIETREHLSKAIVECDGHDFHERTKEQAKHDRSRDRELQGMGYKILRFTGSEIWQDPVGCAVQVQDGMSRSMS